MLKAKDKEKILKAQKQLITYKGTPIRLTTDFSPEAMEAGRSTFQSAPGRNVPARIPLSSEAIFRRLR